VGGFSVLNPLSTKHYEHARKIGMTFFSKKQSGIEWRRVLEAEGLWALTEVWKVESPR
jgi:alkylated DNA nucleotide flippase Atl1